MEVTTVVKEHKDMLRDVLESSKRNMQYHISEAISAKNYNQPKHHGRSRAV